MRQQPSEAEHRLTAWMILTAINNPSLLQQPRALLQRFWEEPEKTFESLTKKYHCDPIMLYDSLAMVKPLQHSLPTIHQRELLRFANRLEVDVKKMKSLVPSHS